MGVHEHGRPVFFALSAGGFFLEMLPTDSFCTGAILALQRCVILPLGASARLPSRCKEPSAPEAETASQVRRKESPSPYVASNFEDGTWPRRGNRSAHYYVVLMPLRRSVRSRRGRDLVPNCFLKRTVAVVEAFGSQ